MTDTLPSVESDQKAESDHKAEADKGGIVIEASWAPKDPRDRLYDSSATAGEKRASLIRIFASFHPVLNSIVLTNDMVRRLGPVKSLLILAFLAAAIAAFFWL